MSKKGNTTIQQPAMQAPTQKSDRVQSPDELRLLQTQNESLQSGIAIAEEQEARSRQMHDIWKETYLPVETGMIHGDASEANGYMDSASIAHAMDSNNYKAKSRGTSTCSSCGGSGHRSGGTCSSCNGAGVKETTPRTSTPASLQRGRDYQGSASRSGSKGGRPKPKPAGKGGSSRFQGSGNSNAVAQSILNRGKQ